MNANLWTIAPRPRIHSSQQLTRPKHFFVKRLGSHSLYLAAPKMGRAEVPAGSTGGEGAVGRPRSHEAADFFGLAKSFIQVRRVARRRLCAECAASGVPNLH
jgi:hypothetical protein